MATTRKNDAPKTFLKGESRRVAGNPRPERPDPKTELDFVNPYTLVVAVALSAQATDVANKATKSSFRLLTHLKNAGTGRRGRG